MIPAQYDRIEFYHSCERRIVEVFATLPGVSSIHRFGSISAVGNSDIDLLFVVNRDLYKPRSIQRLLRSRFTSDERFLVAQHEPLILPRELVGKANLIRPVGTPVYLWGEALNIEALTNPFEKFYVLADLLVDYYPRVLVENRTRVREVLQFIHAVRFVDELYSSIRDFFELGRLTSATAFGMMLEENNEVRRLCKQSGEEEIRRHVDRAVGISLELTAEAKRSLAAWIRNNAPTSYSTQSLRIGSRVFTDSIGANTEHVVLKWRGKSAAFYANPRSLAGLFVPQGDLPPNLGEAIDRRNAVIRAYVKFNSRQNGNTNIYVPWWIGAGGRLPDRLRRIVCEAYALIGTPFKRI